MSRLFEKVHDKPATSSISKSSATEYSTQQRRLLLRLAHDAILSKLELGQAPEIASDQAWLLEPRGVFTTLYLHGNLRGCVGYAMPVAPLFRAVTETACAAAFNDPRFSPVTQSEATDLEVSLSVLSPLQPIRADEVVIGEHGVLISRGSHRGLLLPQVAVENGWDRKTFLEQTCRKANLPIDAWRVDATIEAFSAEVFGDSDMKTR